MRQADVLSILKTLDMLGVTIDLQVEDVYYIEQIDFIYMVKRVKDKYGDVSACVLS